MITCQGTTQAPGGAHFGRHCGAGREDRAAHYRSWFSRCVRGKSAGSVTGGADRRPRGGERHWPILERQWRTRHFRIGDLDITTAH
jgi:hypothetical protein